MIEERYIKHNKARCKNCNDIIESLYRHDFVFCKCGAISIDGGKDYLKRSSENPEDVEELSEYFYKPKKK